jgi:hypothetical protein
VNQDQDSVIPLVKLQQIDWNIWRQILDTFDDHVEFFDEILDNYREQYARLVIEYGVRFYHPYLPLTAEKRQLLSDLVNEQLALTMPPAKKLNKSRCCFFSSRSDESVNDDKIADKKQSLKRKHD